MDIGRITALAFRSAPGARPVSSQHLNLMGGLGIAGDAHSLPFSPRQLLLAGEGVYQDLALPPHALKENVLLDIETAQLSSGTLLQLGAEVTIRLMFQCEACAALDAHRPGLASRIAARRGILALVVAGGSIRTGDIVRDLGQRMPAWPDDWRERIRRVLDAMPDAAVIEYRQLARLAGIQSTYCRAFPRLLLRLGPHYAAKAVRTGSPSTAKRWDGQGLFDNA